MCRYICRKWAMLLPVVCALMLVAQSACLCQPVSTGKALWHAACDEPNCSFAVQSTDTADIRFIFGSHFVPAHSTKVSPERIGALLREGAYKSPSPGSFCVVCPSGDGFALWSTSKDELVFLFGHHTQLYENKSMSDEDLTALIKRAGK
jgi:hypothetical protein